MDTHELFLKKYVVNCWYSAENAYRNYTNFNGDGEDYCSNFSELNKQSSLAYLCQAHTSAELLTLYYLQNFEGEFEWIDEFLEKFNRYNNEFLESYSSEHDMQHTVIYFDDFKEAYELVRKYLP